MLVGLSTVQAADTTLTLACQNDYYTMMNLHTGGIVYSIRYVLKCRPAQRMF
jgi:hypothetical protein